MRNLVLLLSCVVLLSSCTVAKETQFAEHNTLFRNWDHLKFSLWGYKQPSEETYRKTIEQGWWGEPIPYSP
ncbi:MAG: hypothetical protein JRH18_04620 [Deltaproteobacteria bacterium]|nr:hypothetical protein [Deltaproteobacteria bacterium]